MRPRNTIVVPTKEEIFGTGFPFGHNAPQDSQEFQDSHRLSRPTRLSSTSKEKQRAQFSTSEKGPASLLPGQFDLSEWVKHGYDSHTEQPGSEWDHWHSPLFYFARFVKAHPDVTELSDYEAAKQIEDLMRQWLPPGEASNPWEHFFAEVSGDGEAARLDFMTSWNAVRHVPFHDVLSNALRLADEKPLVPPHERGRQYQRFISLTGWLQVLLPGKPILLPTRKLDALLGCDQRTVSRLRKLAVQDRLLVIVKQHSYRAGAKSAATEFRFAIECYPELVGRQK